MSASTFLPPPISELHVHRVSSSNGKRNPDPPPRVSLLALPAFRFCFLPAACGEVRWAFFFYLDYVMTERPPPSRRSPGSSFFPTLQEFFLLLSGHSGIRNFITTSFQGTPQYVVPYFLFKIRRVVPPSAKASFQPCFPATE